MMPPFMSSLTAVAVVAAPNPAHRSRTPGTTYMTYESWAVPVSIAPPKK